MDECVTPITNKNIPKRGVHNFPTSSEVNNLDSPRELFCFHETKFDKYRQFDSKIEDFDDELYGVRVNPVKSFWSIDKAENSSCSSN